ncbi:MAG: hypothetical protein H6706_03855 [Myxococcales bacterium]|nr:hypothetical protein [Myxococcales bacterium]
MTRTLAFLLLIASPALADRGAVHPDLATCAAARKRMPGGPVVVARVEAVDTLVVAPRAPRPARLPPDQVRLRVLEVLAGGAASARLTRAAEAGPVPVYWMGQLGRGERWASPPVGSTLIVPIDAPQAGDGAFAVRAGTCVLTHTAANVAAVRAELARRAAGPEDLERAYAALRDHRQAVEEVHCPIVGGTWQDGACVGLPMPTVAWEAVLPRPQAECARTGGAWFTFSSTCTDTCSYHPPGSCGQVLTDACQCGAGRCWLDGPAGAGTCVDAPVWHHSLDLDEIDTDYLFKRRPAGP